MTGSNTIGDRLVAIAQVAGVLATAWFVWVTAILPRMGFSSLAALVSEALLYVVLAWLAGAFITFCIYFVVSLNDLPQSTRFSFRSSAPAMWFAPAIVLLSTPFTGAFFVSLFLVANATRQLIAQWVGLESPVYGLESADVDPPLLLGAAGPDTSFLSWNAIPVLLGSSAAQAGLVALLWRHPFLASALFALSTAVLTSLAISTGAYRPGKPPALPHSALSVAMTFLLAAAMTLGGISARGRSLTGPETPNGSSPAGGGSTPLPDPTAPLDDSPALGGDFPGVVLLPEVQPHVTLVEPLTSTSGMAGVPLRKPVGIPFSGSYWMFRFPARRPPRTSIVHHGNPATLAFHTTDGMSMEMEAHQKLDNPIDAHCCSQIQLVIRNADPFPDSVVLELNLIDSQVPNFVEHLGTAAAGSSAPSEKTVSFRFPPEGTLKVFDELQIIFRRPRWRGDKSARISIERFVLLP